MATATTDRLTGLQEDLAAQVGDLTDSDAWRAMLDTAAKFHRYSANNCLLIALQNPDATRVAGFRAWQGMGRQVRKGERALFILAPVTYRDRDDNDAADAKPTGPRRVRGFRGAAVFDISQTDGEPLPSVIPAEPLAGEAPADVTARVCADLEHRGYTVDLDGETRGDLQGRTNYTDRTVTVYAPDVSPLERFAILCHEWAHVALHDPESTERDGHRGVREVEAESVTYVALAASGITQGSSISYVAGWAGTATSEVLQTTASRVVKTAHLLLTITDPQAEDAEL